jgi:hypothetical protein
MEISSIIDLLHEKDYRILTILPEQGNQYLSIEEKHLLLWSFTNYQKTISKMIIMKVIMCNPYLLEASIVPILDNYITELDESGKIFDNTVRNICQEDTELLLQITINGIGDGQTCLRNAIRYIRKCIINHSVIVEEEITDWNNAQKVIPAEWRRICKYLGTQIQLKRRNE